MRTIETQWGIFECPEGDAVGNALAEGHFWDAHLKPYFDEADPNGIAIDIGAYIGFHTVYLAKRYQLVIAAEPRLSNYEHLCRNLHRNVACALAFPIAAYSHRTTLRQTSAEETGWDTNHPSNAPSVPYRECSESGLTLAWPFDLLIGDQGPVTLIKIDAQGCDLRALFGLERTIKRDRPLIVFEYEAGYSIWHGDDWPSYLAWGERMGYSIDQITTDYWDYVARPKEQAK